MKKIIAKVLLPVFSLAIVAVSSSLVTAAVYKERAVQSTTVPVASTYEDALQQFSLEHDQLRSMQLQGLDEIINSEKSSQEIIESAQKQKMELLDQMEKEQTVAGVLRARGFIDAAVAASEDHVNIMIRASQAGQEAVLRITELVNAETGLKAEDIKIIPIN